jgi:hypothetical protein
MKGQTTCESVIPDLIRNPASLIGRDKSRPYRPVPTM